MFPQRSGVLIVFFFFFFFVSTAQFVSLSVINQSSPGSSCTFFLYTFFTTFVTSVFEVLVPVACEHVMSSISKQEKNI